MESQERHKAHQREEICQKIRFSRLFDFFRTHTVDGKGMKPKRMLINVLKAITMRQK